jgi:hypothetical protein
MYNESVEYFLFSMLRASLWLSVIPNLQFVRNHIKGEKIFRLFICGCCIYLSSHVKPIIKNKRLIKVMPLNYASCWDFTFVFCDNIK